MARDSQVLRVYEFSKQFGVPNKQLLSWLQEGGYEVASHMSVLAPAAQAYLQTKIAPVATKPSSVKPVASKLEKSELVSPVATAPVVATPTVASMVQARHITNKNLSNNSVKTPVVATGGTGSEGHLAVNLSRGIGAARPAAQKIILRPMVLTEFAQLLGVAPSEVIVDLLKLGAVYNRNQVVPIDLIAKLAQRLGLEIERPEKTGASALRKGPAVQVGAEVQRRNPIVVVVGHVDHGKTTLLDFIRKTRVAAREAGGITQHLGAYKVATSHGDIVFLDTPGHEIFSAIRSRGLAAADVAILVVAGDDGIKPQTVEAIDYIKRAGITAVVAVNKMDKAAPERLEVIRTQLAQHGLMPEEWGGDVVVLPISAKTGHGVDKLLEMVALQAELLELTADPLLPACGYVLESHVKKGRGPVATFVAQHGTLKIGDYFTCGKTRGKVTALIDPSDKNLSSIGAAEPILLAGFEEIPQAGDYLQVISAESYRKNHEPIAPNTRGSLPLSSSAHSESINLIIKADTDSSREAICDSIDKLNKGQDKVIKIVSASVGNVSEKDIILANTVAAKIVTFNTKIDAQARDLARQQRVEILEFAIIYKLIDALSAELESQRVVEVKKEKIGILVIRKIFDIKGVGVIAGFGVRDGYVINTAEVKVLRGRNYVGAGPIKSLQSDKKTVNKITAGYEGALMVKGFEDWLVGDLVEVYAPAKAA